MRFGPVPVKEAAGALLAHSIDLPGGKLPKGRLLSEAECAALEAAGLESVIVARLDPSDLHEDAAAAQIAASLVPDSAGQNLSVTGAATGRVNLYATVAGVAQIDVAAIGQLNSVNPLITLATVPEWFRTDPRTMIATVKIIAYGVPQQDVDQAAAAARRAIAVRPVVWQTATLIETMIDADIPSDKGRKAIHGRLHRMGVALTERCLVPHRADDIAAAIQAAPGQMVLILTASATSDPQDVAPSGLRLAGGRVERFGMPVDPGNLLFHGDYQGRPVIGLPGCARSPALNGADWVLERLLCGVAVTAEDIAAMGVGGLLKEIPTRPSPREG